MLELTLRLVFSLAVVIGLLLLLAKVGQKRFKGGNGALIRVVHRQALSRTSAVAVVTVGSRVLVLGTTEQQVSVLAELDPEELVLEEQSATGSVVEDLDISAPQDLPPIPPVDVPTVPQQGVLVGSVLSPNTWKQALAVLSSGGGTRVDRQRP